MLPDLRSAVTNALFTALCVSEATLAREAKNLLSVVYQLFRQCGHDVAAV